MKIKNKARLLSNIVLLIMWLVYLTLKNPSKHTILNIPTNTLLGYIMIALSIFNIYKSIDFTKQIDQ